MKTDPNVLKVASLDPGVTTGWTKGYVNCDEGHLKFAAGQTRFTHRELSEWLATTYPHILIYETFAFSYKKPGVDVTPLELTGIIKMHCQYYPTKLVPQKPAEGKSYFDGDTHLKRLNCWIPGEDHSRDAIRHLLQWWIHGGGGKWRKVEEPELVSSSDREAFITWVDGYGRS